MNDDNTKNNLINWTFSLLLSFSLDLTFSFFFFLTRQQLKLFCEKKRSRRAQKNDLNKSFNEPKQRNFKFQFNLVYDRLEYYKKSQLDT